MRTLITKASPIKRAILLTSLAAAVNVASAAQIELVNHDFETGDLTGWQSIGDVSAAGATNVETNNGTNYLISPNGSTMAHLNSNGATVSEIETFLGIAQGSLFAAQDTGDTVNNGGGFPGGDDDFPGGDDDFPEDYEQDGNYELTNGSAIFQSFSANAGDTVAMSWNYVARDYIPYTDPSFAVLIAPDGETLIEVLASTTGPGLPTGSDGISGVFSFAQELDQTGEYKLGFAVTNSGDTVLDAALFLDDAPGDCNPSCNDLGSPENPLLPEDDDTPDTFDFTFEVLEPSVPIFIDPIIAVGYDYVVNSGPNVASVILPDLGDGAYEIYGWDGTDFSIFLGNALANIAFDFAVGGVDMFRVLGIETGEMLDPTDPTAFVTGLTFVASGVVDMSQTPVTLDVPASVPEPGSIALFGMGLIGLNLARRRSNHS